MRSESRGKTPLLCPLCRAWLLDYGSLVLELPGREASIYTYQWLACEACDSRFFGVLEEFLPVFDDDLIHTGYEAEPREWEASLALLAQCPQPSSKRCTCRAHERFRRRGLSGRGKSYPLRLG